jgi:hypothetical protein
VITTGRSELLQDEGMKRLQFMIEEDLDAELGIRAPREGVSKAALVRRYLSERLRLPPLEENPPWEIVGMIPGQSPDESSRIDEVVYDLRARRDEAP